MSLATKKMFENYKMTLDKMMEKPKRSADPRIIDMKPDTTLRVRLLFYVEPGSDRSGPFVEKYIHYVFDPATKQGSTVVCPTSLYISGNAGFRDCPICTNNSNLWNDYKANQSLSSKELYDKFKRKFYGFALVYVINDPTNKDNNGKVRILKYGVSISNFFQKEIFGKDVKSKDNEPEERYSDCVGSAAFDLDSGYDLIIAIEKNVTPIGTYNKYSPKFAREKTPVNVDKEQLERQIKELSFDKDFLVRSTREDIMKFYQDHVLGTTIGESTDEVTDDLSDGEQAPAKEHEQPKKDAPAPLPAAEELDVDKLLAEIENEG